MFSHGSTPPAPGIHLRHVLSLWVMMCGRCVVPTVLFLASRLGTEADTGDDRAISVLIDMLADKDPDFRIGALRV